MLTVFDPHVSSIPVFATHRGEMDIEMCGCVCLCECICARFYQRRWVIFTHALNIQHAVTRGAPWKSVLFHSCTHIHTVLEMVWFILTMWNDTFTAFCSSDVSHFRKGVVAGRGTMNLPNSSIIVFVAPGKTFLIKPFVMGLNVILTNLKFPSVVI